MEVASSDYLHQGYQQPLDYEHQPTGEVEGWAHHRYKQDYFEYSFYEVCGLFLDQVEVLVLINFVYLAYSKGRPARDKKNEKE